MAPSIIIRDGGVRDALAVRCPDATDRYSKEKGGDGTRYVTGFYKEVMPEFSCVMPDARGLPKRECRGWRTVVLSLVKQHIISYKDAVSVFGEPYGVRACRWMEILREQRA
jgi:hypothetical protein